MTNKNQNKLFVEELTEAITVGALEMYVANIENIYTVIEDFQNTDGERAFLKSLKYHIRIYNEHNMFCRALLVQTAGTISDNDNQSNGTFGFMLNANIDDVFSFNFLGDLKVSRQVPNTAAANLYGIESTLVVPQHIIQLINKNVEQERLQELFLVIIGRGSEGDVTSMNIFRNTEYIVTRKNMMIR